MNAMIEKMSTELQLIKGDLPKIEAALPQMLRNFYDWTATQPELKKIITKSGKSTKDLAISQQKHWMRLLATGPTDETKSTSYKIGHIHHRIGLTPEFYMAGYGQILDQLCELIGKSHRFNGGLVGRKIAVITKILMADMEAALSAYSGDGETQATVESGIKFANTMMDSTVNVSIAINEAAISAVRMQYAIEKVDQQAQTISAAVEETVTGIKQISDNSEQVSEISKRANQSTNDGARIVSDAAEKMDTITEVVQTTSNLVNELSESSKQIAEIVQTIEDIANQTNLLALNATIEAARAGEAGKGFAVVANEVKSLSSQTGRATDEIRARIQGLVSNMDQIVSSMSHANTVVLEGQEAMSLASSTMTDINANVEEVAVRMDQESHILLEQTEASNEVASGVARIAKESGENVSALEDTRNNLNLVVSDIGKQLATLFEHNLPNKVIRIAKSDHVIWKKRLVDMLAGKESLREDELSSHESCRLGKFYYGPQAAMYRTLPEFIALEEPHRQVHQHGIEAVRLYNRGDIDGALHEIAQVETASQKVLTLLDAIAKTPDPNFEKNPTF